MTRDAKAADRSFHLGVQAQSAGQMSEAERHYRDQIQRAPDHAAALANLGSVLRRTGRGAEALELLQRAASIPSATGEAIYNFANALADAGRTTEAITELRRATAKSPGLARAHLRLGLLLADAGAANKDESIRALTAAARHVQAADQGLTKGTAWPRAAALLFEAGDPDSAIPIFAAIASARPQNADAHFNHAVALMRASHHASALDAYRRAAELDPGHSDAVTGVANSLVVTGAPDEALQVYEAALADPRHRARIASAYLMALLYDHRRSGAEVARIHRELASELFPSAAAVMRHPRSDHSQLRVGYITADLSAAQHPVEQFLRPILERHAKAGVDHRIYLNADRAAATALPTDAWSTRKTVVHLDDAATAAAIARDEIDLLVDLSGHTRGHRLGVFAQRPARVNATFMGYPHTTGLAAIDHLIADPIVAPAEDQGLVAERIAHLPHAFLCFSPPETMPVPSGVKRGGPPVFGSLNHLPKLGPATMALWAEVLKAVPGSRLLVKCGPFAEKEIRARFAAKMAALGIAPDRLDLEGPEQFADAMRAYERIDIALDPTPYNGGTTTAHALWMGVPVVTLIGDRFCGRMGASLSTAAGMTENIATTATAYVARATALAADVERLRAARLTQHDAVRMSPLCDVDRYSNALLAVYRQLVFGAAT